MHYLTLLFFIPSSLAAPGESPYAGRPPLYSCPNGNNAVVKVSGTSSSEPPSLDTCQVLCKQNNFSGNVSLHQSTPDPFHTPPGWDKKTVSPFSRRFLSWSMGQGKRDTNNEVSGLLFRLVLLC